MNKSKTSANGFTSTIGLWFAKFPSLPKNVQLFIVKIIPFLALLVGILGIANTSDIFGGSILFGYNQDFFITILSLFASILVLSAFPGLHAREIRGWNLLFWSEGVNLILEIVAVYQSSILLALIGAIFCYYILFQIRQYYK